MAALHHIHSRPLQSPGGCLVQLPGSPHRLPLASNHISTTSRHNSATFTSSRLLRPLVACQLAAQVLDTDAAHTVEEVARPIRRAPDGPLFKSCLEDIAGASKHMLRDAQGRLSLKNFTRKQLEDWCTAIGESPKRALQVWRWMYADGCWVHSLQDTLGKQNGLGAKFIEAAEHASTCDGGLQLQQVVRARDGTRKLVFKLTAGEAAGGTVETVLIPVVRSAGQRARITLCVSSQVGCAMNCQFCYTGRMGLLGNLTTAQIIEQVVEARRFMASEGDTTPLTNLVFMGMGEPLHNPDAVADAIEIMSCYLGLHMSHNKVTVSTVGLIPQIEQVVPRMRAQLAVSLHATTDEVRDWIVPINRRYPLQQLMASLRRLFPLEQPHAVLPPPAGVSEQPVSQEDGTQIKADHSQGLGRAQPSVVQLGVMQKEEASTRQAQQDQQAQQSAYVTTTASARRSRRDRERGSSEMAGGEQQGGGEEEEGGEGHGAGPQHSTLLIAYTMLKGINDTPEDAHRLLGLLDGIAAKVNLICFNPHEGTTFLPSDDKDVLEFRSILVQGGRVCTIRNSRGDDEMAACGQLGDVGLSWKPAPHIQPPERFRQLLEAQQVELQARINAQL